MCVEGEARDTHSCTVNFRRKWSHYSCFESHSLSLFRSRSRSASDGMFSCCTSNLVSTFFSIAAVWYLWCDFPWIPFTVDMKYQQENHQFVMEVHQCFVSPVSNPLDKSFILPVPERCILCTSVWSGYASGHGIQNQRVRKGPIILRSIHCILVLISWYEMPSFLRAKTWCKPPPIILVPWSNSVQLTSKPTKLRLVCTFTNSRSCL